MKYLATFTVLLLSGLVSSAPLSEETLIVTSEFFPESLSIYTSEHDIVNLFCPINSLNFDEEADIESLEGTNIHVFFVEADINDGVYDYKGLYVMKNRKATKLLDNGRDFAASSDDSKKVFFATTDGIYTYNAEANKADKYGTVSESLIGIAMTNTTDFLYVLTEDRILYKVTDEGTKKEEITDVKDATQIVIDFEDNLYFLDSKKHVYVKSVDGVKKIKGVPASPAFAKLVRPPFVLDDGVPFIAGKKIYTVYPNTTSEYSNIVLRAKPTAFSLEATLLQYYAYNKQIYEYNLLAIIMGSVELQEVQEYFADKSDDIKTIGTKSRKALRSRK